MTGAKEVGIKGEHQVQSVKSEAGVLCDGSPDAFSPERPKGPIFVYSGFRASSTWLWSKFRAHKGLLCYYEPFNEQMGSLTLDNISEARPENWRSHHPNVAPYALEYAGMLDSGQGVAGFPAIRNLGERYTGAAGPEGSLDEDVAAYVQGLIDHAHERHRTPLLACTRLLGRAHGLKAAFGGYHILLVRNLFQQWNSYAGQARFGNCYFLQTLYETLELAKCDPIIARLTQAFPKETLSSLDVWVAHGNFDRVFCYFVGFHLYFLTLARRSADLVIDANALAAPDTSYRHGIVTRIAHDTGIKLNLDDASERVDFPIHPIADHHACIIQTSEIAARIKVHCNADADEQSFIDSLLSDMWNEQALFQRQTAGAIEYLAQVEAECEAHCKARVRASCQEADQKAQEGEGERKALLLALNDARREITEVEGKLGATIATLQVQLAEQKVVIATAQADFAHEQVAGVKRLEFARRQMEEKAEELATVSEELARIRDASRTADEAAALVRSEVEAERARSVHHQAQAAAAMMEVESLRFVLAKAEAAEAGSQDRLGQLERTIANLDAANIDLAAQLLHAQRAAQELDGHLAAEKADREQLNSKLERIFSNPDAPHRLRLLLELLMTRRVAWALLPEPIWNRKLGDSIKALPGLERGFEELERNPSLDRLAQNLWIALLRGA